MKQRQNGAPKRIYPLLVPPSMSLEIKRQAKSSGLSDADIMRLAIERGMPTVRGLFHPEPEEKVA